MFAEFCLALFPHQTMQTHPGSPAVACLQVKREPRSDFQDSLIFSFLLKQEEVWGKLDLVRAKETLVVTGAL